MVSRDFLKQLDGYGLTTVEIHYFMPDHPSLLQLFVWQEYDVAPRFPVLHEFLGASVDLGGRDLERQLQ